MEEECEVCHGTDPRCERTKPMTWQERFDEQFADLEYISDTPDAETRLKSFISQTHKDLVEAILEEIPNDMTIINYMGEVTGLSNNLKYSLRAKYLNNTTKELE